MYNLKVGNSLISSASICFQETLLRLTAIKLIFNYRFYTFSAKALTKLTIDLQCEH